MAGPKTTNYTDEQIKTLLAQKLRDSSPEDYLKVVEQEKEIVKKVKETSAFSKEVTKVLLFMSLMKDYAKRDYTDVSAKTVVAVGFGLAYLISPIDLIPDFAPGGIGFVDDIILLGLVWLMVRDEIKPYVAWKAPKKTRATTTCASSSTAPEQHHRCRAADGRQNREGKMSGSTDNPDLNDEKIKQLLAEKLADGVPEEYLPVVEQENAIVKKVRGQSVLVNEVTKVLLFLALMKDYAKGDYREVSPKTIVAVGFGLTYLVWPQDIIPDYLPGGLIDDAIVLGVVWLMVRKEIEPYVIWKAERDPEYEGVRKELYGA